MKRSCARATRSLLALLALATLLGACGSPRRSAALGGPLDSADASVQRGHVAFDEHCFKCHATGEGALGSALNNKPLPRALIRLQIRAGLGAMPAFPEHVLSDREVEDIANYVVALRRHGR